MKVSTRKNKNNPEWLFWGVSSKLVIGDEVIFGALRVTRLAIWPGQPSTCNGRKEAFRENLNSRLLYYKKVINIWGSPLVVKCHFKHFHCFRLFYLTFSWGVTYNKLKNLLVDHVVMPRLSFLLVYFWNLNFTFFHLCIVKILLIKIFE